MEGVLRMIGRQALIPIFSHDDPEVCKKVLKAAYDGGCRLFEFTKRTDSAPAVFKALKAMTVKEMPDLYLGMGTILDKESTDYFIDAGADFIVSPITEEGMAMATAEKEVLWIPGCSTVNEIIRATRLGARLIKLFPAQQLGGPSYIRAVRGPLPAVRIIPTGGVDPSLQNLKSWFDAGAFAVGMGSKLFRKDLVDKANYPDIADIINTSLETIHQLRNKQ